MGNGIKLHHNLSSKEKSGCIKKACNVCMFLEDKDLWGNLLKQAESWKERDKAES